MTWTWLEEGWQARRYRHRVTGVLSKISTYDVQGDGQTWFTLEALPTFVHVGNAVYRKRDPETVRVARPVFEADWEQVRCQDAPGPCCERADDTETLRWSNAENGFEVVVRIFHDSSEYARARWCPFCGSDFDAIVATAIETEENERVIQAVVEADRIEDR